MFDTCYVRRKLFLYASVGARKKIRGCQQGAEGKPRFDKILSKVRYVYISKLELATISLCSERLCNTVFHYHTRVIRKRIPWDEFQTRKLHNMGGGRTQRKMVASESCMDASLGVFSTPPPFSRNPAFEKSSDEGVVLSHHPRVIVSYGICCADTAKI